MKLATSLALGALAVGLVEGSAILRDNARGESAASAKVFAETPMLWAAVHRYSSPEERIGNNPLFLQDMTPWPVNISWALLANRPSCFAGRELALAYTSLPAARREQINTQFIRVFNGQGTPDDVRDLAARYDCRLIVVTAQDPIWSDDPFAASHFYVLVTERPMHWRIYRAATVWEIEKSPQPASYRPRADAQMPANQLKPRSAQ